MRLIRYLDLSDNPTPSQTNSSDIKRYNDTVTARGLNVMLTVSFSVGIFFVL